MTAVFYRKVGRRYIPANYYDDEVLRSMPVGTHLVHVHANGRTYRHYVDPALAPMLAACELFREEMTQILMKASELRPEKSELTGQQQQAWQAFLETLPEGERYYVTHGSAHNMLFAAVTQMSEHAQGLLEHESLRLAWDHFMFLAHLVCEEKLGGTGK